MRSTRPPPIQAATHSCIWAVHVCVRLTQDAHGSFVFDLACAIPFWSLADAERNKYWDDHIHLTSAGYDLMGEKIAARLVELIMPPGRLQPQTNGGRTAKRRRFFKDDDKVFEEEVGDDNLLDQGYYVVRRKDLE